jgi:hypothetical protein
MKPTAGLLLVNAIIQTLIDIQGINFSEPTYLDLNLVQI